MPDVVADRYAYVLSDLFYSAKVLLFCTNTRGIHIDTLRNGNRLSWMLQS